MADGIPYDPVFIYEGPSSAATIYDRCTVFNTNCTCQTPQSAWRVHSGSCVFTDTNNDGQDDRAPSYVKTGNRRNFDALLNPPKLDVAKSIIDGLLQDPANDGLRFGLMVLNGAYLPSDYTNPTQLATYHNDTTVLKAIVGTDHAALRGIVNAINANAGTPLGNRAIAVGKYLANDGTFGGVDPIAEACQPNFLVILTDGRSQVEGDRAFGNCMPGFNNPFCGSNATGSFSYIESWLGIPYDKDGDGRDPDPSHFNPPAGCTPNASPEADPCEYYNGGSDYLDDIAKKLFDDDLRASLPGLQHVITSTIGFEVSYSLLQRTALHGGERTSAPTPQMSWPTPSPLR